MKQQLFAQSRNFYFYQPETLIDNLATASIKSEHGYQTKATEHGGGEVGEATVDRSDTGAAQGDRASCGGGAVVEAKGWWRMRIYKREDGDRVSWAVDYHFGGKRYRLHAGSSEKAAKALRLRVETEINEGRHDPARLAAELRGGQVRGALTVPALIDKFLEGYVSRGGTDYYSHVLKAARDHFANVPADSLDAAALDGYLAARRGLTKSDGSRRVGESSLRHEMLGLSKLYKWSCARGLVASSPFVNFEKPKQPPGPPPRALTLDEETALLALLPPLERDVVEWAIYTGMDRGDLLKMTWRQVDLKAGKVHYVRGKTGKACVVPLNVSERLAAILTRHPRRTTTDLVFHDTAGQPLDVDRLNGTVEAALTTAKVPKTRGVMWRLFRKTTSSRLYAGGKVMPQDEAAMLGHSIEVAWKNYVQLSPAADERTKGALDSMWHAVGTKHNQETA